MQTATKGNVSEAAVLNAFVERGLDVLVPFGEGQAYDLVVHISPDAFIRVQCKTAWRRAGSLTFNARATDHGRGRLSYEGQADLFGVYFPPTQSVYLVPVHEVSHLFVPTLRLDPTRNNQRRGVRLARDFELDRWTVEALCNLVGSEAPRPEPDFPLGAAVVDARELG